MTKGGGKRTSTGNEGGCACHHCDCDEHRLERKDGKTTLLLDPVAAPIILKRKEGARHVLLRVKAHADYAPGQFFQLTVLGFGEAPISIASYSKEHIDLLINPVGSVTKEAVRKGKGDTLLLRGPYGYGYPMDYFRNNGLVLIGGGCGVAPLKGVLDHVALHREQYRDVRCFWGYRAPEEAIFTKEFDRWERDGVFTFTVAYSKPPDGFVGKTGFVTDYLDAIGGSDGKAALICGPTPMMLGAVKALQERGWRDDQIWISHERHMKCATGMCGHCMIEGKYTCKDGPVFRWDWIKGAKG